MMQTFPIRAMAIAVIVLSILLAVPVTARQASDSDRRSMAIEVANYVRDPYGTSSHPNAFGTSASIGIGAVAIEGHYALADWRTTNGSRWGQISFFFVCDHWNLGSISTGRRITAKELLGLPRPAPHEPNPTTLIAELRTLEARHFPLISLPRPERGC